MNLAEPYPLILTTSGFQIKDSSDRVYPLYLKQRPS